MGIRWSSTDGKQDPKSQGVLPEKLGKEDSFSEFQHRLQAFIKGGGCSATYTAFQDCVEEAEMNKEEPISKCYFMLEKCMEDHSDYYHPYLAAKKSAMQLLMKDLLPSTYWRDHLVNSSVVSSPMQLKEVEEEEQRFLAFMREGGCKEPFTAWEECADEAEKNKEDILKKCVGVFSMMTKCMDAHSDHYHPLLAAKQSVEEQMIKDLQAFLSQPR